MAAKQDEKPTSRGTYYWSRKVTIEQRINSILPSIEHFHLLGYWVAFFVAFLEIALAIGLLLPGSTLLLLLGALPATGHLYFAGILWFAVAGAVLGDNLYFWLGDRYGRIWIRDGDWLLNPAQFEQVRLFFCISAVCRRC